MNQSPEIEQIIRQVLERLSAAGDLVAGIDQITAPMASELVIEERVVTLAQVDGKLQGKQRVRVPSRAVVTPAVSDLLRSKKIELVRGGTSSQQASSHRAPVLVCGTAPWFASLSKHLCPKQAKVEACDEANASQLIAAHLSRVDRERSGFPILLSRPAYRWPFRLLPRRVAAIAARTERCPGTSESTSLHSGCTALDRRGNRQPGALPEQR